MVMEEKRKTGLGEGREWTTVRTLPEKGTRLSFVKHRHGRSLLRLFSSSEEWEKQRRRPFWSWERKNEERKHGGHFWQGFFVKGKRKNEGTGAKPVYMELGFDSDPTWFVSPNKFRWGQLIFLLRSCTGTRSCKSPRNDPKQERSTLGCGKHVGTDDPTSWDSFLTTLAAIVIEKTIILGL